MPANYSDRLLCRGNFATRFSHRARFNKIVALIGRGSFDACLDMGCADGYVLKALHGRNKIRCGVGVDADIPELARCQKSCSSEKKLRFLPPEEMEKELRAHSFDLVLCTETLEHVKDPEELIKKIANYTKANGRLIISAPIEIGPSLMVKQVFRYLANLNGRYGYESYRMAELFSACFSIIRPYDDLRYAFPGRHKGFDFRRLDRLIRRYFVVEKIIYSPLNVLKSFLNSTVIWLCKL